MAESRHAARALARGPERPAEVGPPGVDACAALQKALRVASEGHDPEGVHQARVAALRIAAALRLRGLVALRTDCAWLRSELRGARDLDVALERELPLALQARLSAERAQAQRRVAAAVRSQRTHGILIGARAALQRLAPDPSALQAPLERVRRAARVALAEPCEFVALHDLRRAVRRVRWMLQALERPTDGWSALQRTLGPPCDASAFLELARRLAVEPALRDELARLCAAVEREGRLRAQHALAPLREQLRPLLRSARP